MGKFDLDRFIKAQKADYEDALAEIRGGHKRSHWIWYIFPQIAGLGFSSMSQYYAIASMEEAKAYMENPYLREHLLEISEALMELESDDPRDVMGWPDDLKLRSSMTLFAEAAPQEKVFQRVLEKYFGGEKDRQTLRILEDMQRE